MSRKPLSEAVVVATNPASAARCASDNPRTRSRMRWAWALKASSCTSCAEFTKAGWPFERTALAALK